MNECKEALAENIIENARLTGKLNKINKLLEYLLKEIQYIRTHTDEISVLAGLNLMETKIMEYKEEIEQ